MSLKYVICINETLHTNFDCDTLVAENNHIYKECESAHLPIINYTFLISCGLGGSTKHLL